MWNKLGATVSDDTMEALARFVQTRADSIKGDVLTRMDRGDGASAIADGFRAEMLPEIKVITTFRKDVIASLSPAIRDKWAGVLHDTLHGYHDLTLGISALEEGDIVVARSAFITFDPCSFRSLLQSIGAAFMGKASIGSVRVEAFRLAPTVDAAAFDEVLKNLIRNAAEHPRSGKDTVNVFVNLVGNRLIVQDFGAGMTPEAVQNIHDGVRIHNGQMVTTDTDETRGHGYGWANIRKACETLGISWEIESQLGKGTTVTLTLPDGFLEPEPTLFEVRDFIADGKLSKDTLRVLTPAGRQLAIEQFEQNGKKAKK